jgi:hypothetical protein
MTMMGSTLQSYASFHTRHHSPRLFSLAGPVRAHAHAHYCFATWASSARIDGNHPNVTYPGDVSCSGGRNAYCSIYRPPGSQFRSVSCHGTLEAGEPFSLHSKSTEINASRYLTLYDLNIQLLNLHSCLFVTPQSGRMRALQTKGRTSLPRCRRAWSG